MKLDQLTGLRFVAALAVFFSHLGLDPSASWIGRLFGQGYVGVSFFFVLSGFVLSYSYKQRLRDNLIDFRSYALLRIARLAPLHLATALPFFVLLYSDNWGAVLGGCLNLLLLQSWVPHAGIYFSLNAPSWSLSNEMFFYMAFGFLAFLSFRRLTYFNLILAIVVISTASLVFLFFPNYMLKGSKSVSNWLFYIFPVFRLLEFVCGMLIYDLWRRGFRPKRSFFTGSVFLLLTAMYFGGYVAEEFRYSLYYVPFVSFLLFSSLRVEAFGVRWLSGTWAIFLGNISFAFYLLHFKILGMLRDSPLLVHVCATAYTVIALIIITSASAVAYLFFEKPTETYLRRKILTRRN